VDAIEDGVNGLLVDPSGLRPALDRLLADAELRRKLGSAARAFSQERSSPEQAAAAILAAYRES
jgi:glycosyltransferase involved in cell wall biosynthesis